ALITVTVSDGQTTTTRTFTVTVNSGPDAPGITITTQVTTQEDTPITVPFTLADPDTPLMNVAISGTSSNTALVANTNIYVNGDGAARFVTIVPSPNQFGPTRI